jgi:hypothetical protein
MKFLYAAYAATWLIHITYLALLSRRFRRLRNEMQEFRKK